MAVQIGILAAGIVLSWLAGQLLKPKDPLGKDDKPTTLATRGSFAPWVRGTRRVGPVFCWAYGRHTRREKVEGGGKGGGSAGKQEIYLEQGMHVLCSGYAFALHEIAQSGKVIFEGPITRDSHPSGTEVDLGDEGAFRIYWGGPDQDGADPDAAYADATDVNSVFPYFCYVIWDLKRLGPTPVWPMMEYVIECRCEESTLTESEAYMEPTFTLDGPSWTITDVVNGAEGTGYFEFQVEDSSVAKPLGHFRLTGNAAGDQDMEILKVDYSVLPKSGGGGFGALLVLGLLFERFVRVYPVGGVSDADVAGQIQHYSNDENDGINLAHAIDELLFAGFPHGAALDRDHFDMDSLEALGVLLETEGVRGSLISQNGATVKEILAGLLMDVSCMLTFDTATGKHKFVPLREPVASDGHVDEDLLIRPLPERKVLLGPQPADKLIFSWPDRSLNFREMTVVVDDDGHATRMEVQRANKVQITSTTNFDTGCMFAERREQEEFAGKEQHTLHTMRGARALIPGATITADGFDDVLRVMEVKPSTTTGKVDLVTRIDVFGVPATDFTPGGPGVDDGVADASMDLSATVVEMPAIATGDDTRMLVGIPRIRAHTAVTHAAIHISRAGTTYTYIGDERSIHTGGTLDAELASTSARYLETLDITVLGDDIDVAPDYSADEESWRLGRFVAVIGTEILFVRSITALGGTSYRLNDVLRARYDTDVATHAEDTPVFLFSSDSLTLFEDALLLPQQDLYVKVQPVAGSALALAAVPPMGGQPYGKGLRPMPCKNLRTVTPLPAVPVFATGEDLSFRWGYQSFDYRAASPALLPAGTARGAIAFEGSFVVELVADGSGTVMETTNVTTPAFSLSNADLVAAFGSEPSTFLIRVSATHNGRTSSTTELLVTRV